MPGWAARRTFALVERNLMVYRRSITPLLAMLVEPIMYLLSVGIGVGVLVGVLNAALGRESVASVPPEQAGLGSGANNTARYLGSALGVTVVSVVAVPSGPVTASALVDGWNRAALVTAAVSLLGALVVLLVGERTAVPVVDEAERPEIGSPRAVDAA